MADSLYHFGRDGIKELYHDPDVPSQISHIKYSVFTPVEYMNLAEIQVVHRETYDPQNAPQQYGLLDNRLGATKKAVCKTCLKNVQECSGHFGYIKLEVPVFHPSYFSHVLQLLQVICKSCSRVLLDDNTRLEYLTQMRNTQEVLMRKELRATIIDKAKKTRICAYCHERNGTVKKNAIAFRITHEIFGGKNDESRQQLLLECESAVQSNPTLGPFLSKAEDEINPARALVMIRKITNEDLELLDMDPMAGRPEDLILNYIIVPPTCIRPSVTSEGSATGNSEDDLTVGLLKIMSANIAVHSEIKKGGDITSLMDKCNLLQLEVASLINSETPGAQPARGAKGKPTRGIVQRLKGKKGRFRGHLSGKRVDFSGRTVISPDPNLGIDEVGVPELVALTMTFPERVYAGNIEELRQCVRNGSEIHPGANYIIDRKDGSKRFLKFGDRHIAATNLREGDIVERHLRNGDTVLFNRQPSLHRISIMAHRARIMPWRTFRFNECVCGPYNADFDGDEMNLHVPQTEEARAEARTLMAVHENLITPRNGEPLVAAIQDFITASYLLSRKDMFLDRAEFCRIAAFIWDGNQQFEIPPPTILKPMKLWTGKQIFQLIMRPNSAPEHQILVSMEVEGRSYSGKGKYQPGIMCPKDGYVVMQNSELLCGTLDKKTLGGGSKANLFHILMRDYSTKTAALCMSRLAKLCARWLMDYGFSIGISDVQPSEDLRSKKKQIIQKGYADCEKLIREYREGILALQPGVSPEASLEGMVSDVLSKLRDNCGSLCVNELHSLNSPLIMAVCGSKGSNINIAQMIACIGQQIVNSKRIPDGFIKRVLPHFARGSKLPNAKGFVKNSFYSGMTGTEFMCHTMAGREGLVDTAVKTAETGYMQRRLMKSLEDLTVHYDDTVRNAAKGVVQFVYGADALDPTQMEAQEKPVDFDRVLSRMRVLYPCKGERSLLPFEIADRVQAALASPMFVGGVEKGVRIPPVSARFREDMEAYFIGKEGDRDKAVIQKYARTRELLQLPRAENSREDLSGADPIATTAAGYCNRVTETHLQKFFEAVRAKFQRAVIEPGTAVGALAAQSIGEPGTQMTLKTFHFAGVASMNVTQGVPRIKEIINASKAISTPIITAQLVNNTEEAEARIVKGRIERTTLGEIARSIKEVFTGRKCYISVTIDRARIAALRLNITLESVIRAVISDSKQPKLQNEHIEKFGDSKIRVTPPDQGRDKMYFCLQKIKLYLPTVLVSGIRTAKRAVICSKKINEKTHEYRLEIEGDGLLSVMGVSGVRGAKTQSNNIMEIESTLGIEAARKKIMDEIQHTMSEHGMSIDTRHVMLLADLMCYRGEVLGITRFGIAKMRDSVLMLASFEKTQDHLFDGAVHRRVDDIAGVSESIILGIPIPVGTGLFRLLHEKPAPLPSAAPFSMLLPRATPTLDLLS